MADVVLVVGARPNYMKASSILLAAPAHGLDVALVDTGQHYDDDLSTLIARDLRMPPPKHRLDAGRGRSALGQLAAIVEALPPVLEAEACKLVVVVGDVTSTLAAALVAARARARPIPLAHVEAGLRSRDRDMPEEINRVIVDHVADLLFCTEPSGVENLEAEGRRRDATVLLVGNTMIDTLHATRARAREANALAAFGLAPRGYGLVTLHRPSNVDDPVRLRGLLEALGEVGRRLPLLFPVHPRTRSRLAAADVPPGVRLIEPQGYLAFLGLLDQARLVLTDSGGVQEETTALGVPCLTVRENTERPVTVTHGTNRLVGVDPAAVLVAAREALDAPPPSGSRQVPLWDGKAGDRIAAALAGFLRGGPSAARAAALERGAVG